MSDVTQTTATPQSGIAEFEEGLGDPALRRRSRIWQGIFWVALLGFLAAAPFYLYPVFVMQLLCFALSVVVIGGMGSIAGAVVTGFTLGLVEGITKVFYAPAANTVIFLLMVIVLLVRPNGLFGRQG